LTCTSVCRTRRYRDGDLAYLSTLPPDQARARRSVHAAIDDEIFVMRLARASQREGRQARRGLLKVRRIKITGPAIEFPPRKSR
jgi:hypothetical protein